MTDEPGHKTCLPMAGRELWREEWELITDALSDAKRWRRRELKKPKDDRKIRRYCLMRAEVRRHLAGWFSNDDDALA